MGYKTLTAFNKDCNGIDSSLVRAVVKQIGGWDSFKESARDVSNHGADSGFCGFIYHTDTCAFYAKNRGAILALLNDLSESLGEDILTLVQNFGCLGKDYTLDEIGKTLYGNKNQHETNVANALAWFALEEVCRAYADN